MNPARVLTVAGSDPSGGAGIQADLKTFHALGCYGMAVVAVLTAQNTVGVRAIHAPPPAFVAEQLDAVFADCPPAATKTGMLYSAAIIDQVAASLSRYGASNVVVDPVMVATSGDRLLDESAERAIVERLLPLATLVTPNAAEAAVLTGIAVVDEQSAVAAGRALLGLGARAVLVKGGHWEGDAAVDVLLTAQDPEPSLLRLPRLAVRSTHGTGCTLSAAIAAGLARGRGLGGAVAAAKEFVHRGLAGAWRVGAGAWPVNHLAAAEGAGA